jgi:bacteriocin-like protein
MKKSKKPAFRTLTTTELAQTTGGGNSRLLHLTALKIIVAYLQDQSRHDAQAIDQAGG